MELSNATHGIAPKVLNPIDMLLPPDKSIFSMVAPEMSINPNIHQLVITPATVGLDNAVWIDLAANNGLRRGF